MKGSIRMKGSIVMKESMLQVKGITKRYDGKCVVNHINYDVKVGEIVGFLGPNGAGKSTTIKMITGIEDFDEGAIIVQGRQQTQITKEFSQMLGVVPQDIAVYSDLSAYNNVKFFCTLYGYTGKELARRVEEALQFVGLWDRRKDRPEKFSGGMKRRLNIACSIAHSPKLLIMDEPTVGIDPQSRNYIMEAIKTLNQRGTTVIYVSHYMEEIENLCDHIIIMDHGKILEDMQKSELKAKYEKQGLNNLENIFLSITGKELRDEQAG